MPKKSYCIENNGVLQHTGQQFHRIMKIRSQNDIAYIFKTSSTKIHAIRSKNIQFFIQTPSYVSEDYDC